MKKRILSLALVFAMICTMLPALQISADATTQTSSDDYKAWAQSDSRWGSIPLGSSSVTVSSHGCLVTAVTKLIIQCGLRDSNSFNVATLANWLNANGGFTSYGDLYFNYPASMISGLSNQGYIITWGSYSSSGNNDLLLDYVRRGYHMSINVNNGGHWVAVDEALSLSTGRIYIMDSLYSGQNSGITLDSRYPTFTQVHAYKGGSTPSTSSAPGKPVLNTTFSGPQVTFTWAATANTTHYNLWLAKKNDASAWETVEQIFYAENGVSRTLEDGEYRAQLLSYNSNGREADDSDWLHTWADDVFFTIDQNKRITYYDAAGNLWLEDTVENGSSYTLPSNYPKVNGSYFSGWVYTSGADLFDVRPGEQLEISGDLNLYPVYVTHEEAVSGEPVLIYNIADFTADGYSIEATEKTIHRDIDSSYWTDWSDYSTTEVSVSDTVEVKTTALYKYYYFLCPSCGGREPFWGTSDCGASIPVDTWHVGWFATPYSQCNHQTYSYTTAKYYTTSLGDGQIWNFSSGNLYDTAIGTIDSSGDTEVITTGYSSRNYVEQYETVESTVTAYKITGNQIVKLEVTSLPQKTIYEVGEYLDIGGMVLTATFSDGTRREIDNSYEIDYAYFDSPGTKTITVYYGGQSDTFTVTVKKAVSEEVLQIVLESKRVTKGKEFTVTVDIRNNPGFSYLEMTPVFSPEFTLVKVENGELIPDFTKGKQYVWVADEDVTEDGVLLTFTFSTNDNVEPGSYQVSFNVRTCGNYDEEPVAIEVVQANIEVINYVYGDATGDGVVDGFDVIRLKKYLANYDYDTESSTTDASQGADANGDGKIDGFDVIRLKKYLANYDYETGESTVVLGPQ